MATETVTKAEVLELLADCNLGIGESDQEREERLAAITALEPQNPTLIPTTAADILTGDWKLLYTTSRGILGLNRPPFLKLGTVYQSVRASEQRIYNIAEVNNNLSFLAGVVSVGAGFEVLSHKRVQVKFERAVVGLKSWIGYQDPDSFTGRLDDPKRFPALEVKFDAKKQQGWLDITYLDENLRIGRGNEGSIFVLEKV
ncbi:MAG: PAP/fibrillin family protein [Cyanobacteria bacterium P01_D01_bin.73]